MYINKFISKKYLIKEDLFYQLNVPLTIILSYLVQINIKFILALFKFILLCHISLTCLFVNKC